MKLGIFDTGKGGEIVAERLKAYFPDASFTVVNDRKNLPYGQRTPAEIYQLTTQAIQPLIGTCDAIVIACNTATAAAIEQLRLDYPGKLFVGYEPMIKTAAEMTKTGHIVVLATAATAASGRYQNLITQFAEGIIIDAPDTTNWAALIETDSEHTIDIREVAKSVASGADVIVLACTHYLAMEQTFQNLFPTTKVIEPTAAVARRIAATLVSLPRR